MKYRSNSNCPQRVQLSAFVDGELSGPEQRAIQQHLIRCPDCAQVVEELKALLIQLQSIPKPTYGRKITITPQAGRRPKWAAWQALVAAALIVAVLGYASYSQITHRAAETRLVETYVAEHSLGQTLHVQSFGLYGN